ncbi:hypothetical protein COU18_03480 [Candidatus Kaiserbacteria bacterium CG10_big_fil_rev_8_21_14_0_10_51_14]|uniref:Uncharacterized protein n=1 Tax=Candidatus Kaiserbacteria bacterium CG10_big_fil_rev_8_21_14_0_10_51_14 TaxID=1974610 RepID=A0A2H0UBC1_9BACT|nr:MAG: hypothetical protein COU18_03480 [Candidatus Kaiserbacteria bacterium CG10_big_fil_rev_8_21_14_0_10_51_14]
MVVQKVLSNLKNVKNGTKEDKVAVASGVAIAVVAVLLVGWAIFFFRGIQKGDQTFQTAGSAQSQFNLEGIKEAQQQLQDAYSNTVNGFRDMKEGAQEQ